MDPTNELAVDLTGACAHLVAALVLMIIGAVSVRPVEPRAGYLTMVAGGLVVLDGCCGVLPPVIVRTEVGLEALDAVHACNSLLAVPGLLMQWTCVIAAAVLLTRAILAQDRARRETPS